MRTESSCLNCATPLAGDYCVSCGQRARIGRLRLRSIIEDLAEHALSLEIPMVRSLIDLTVRPGTVVRSYLDGARRRHANPLKYCLLAVAIFLLAQSAAGIKPEDVLPEPGSRFDHGNAELLELRADMVGAVNNYMVVFMLLSLPVLAWLMRVVFWEVDCNVTEHYTACLFLHGHGAVLQAVVLLLGLVDGYASYVALELIPMLLMAWASVTYCAPVRWWSAILRTLLANAAFMIAISVVAVFLGVFFSITRSS